jgi:hypothetical protein
MEKFNQKEHTVKILKNIKVRMIKRKKKRKNPEEINLKDLPFDYYIPMKNCIIDHVYYTQGRGISFGVYYGEGVFFGIRDFGITNEYHWDLGAPSGTVRPQLDLGKLPENIKLSNNNKLFEFLENVEKEYWPLIRLQEKVREKKFLDETREKERLAEETFGPMGYYCSNCETITDKSWARCPNCKKLSGFGNQLYVRFKDNTLWKDWHDYVKKKK